MIFIIPLIFGAVALLTGGAGVLAGLDGMANEEQAKEIAEDAQARHKYACEAIEEVRETTQGLAAQYGEIQIAVKQNTIGRFIALIERIGQTCSYQDRVFVESFEGSKPQQISEYQADRLDAISIATGGMTSVKVGAVAGHSTAALVGFFGTASTGTAISGLSGAAAHSATLAWLGGGSLATGGGGMALGSLVLGGIALGPALLVGGFMLGSKGEKALTKAVEYQAKVDIEIDKIIAVEEFLQKVQNRICELGNLVGELDDRAIDILDDLESKPFNRNRDAVKFQRLALLIKALVEIMKASILGANGKLNPETEIFATKYNNNF
jgi:hypothetical protein